MTAPRIERTPELVEALTDLESLRTDLFIAGVDLEQLNELIGAVRKVDVEIIKARHAFRAGEFYPYFPDSYSIESDAYDTAEELLRSPMPQKEERT